MEQTIRFRLTTEQVSRFVDMAIGLLTEAYNADPSKLVMGPVWHEEYQRAVDLIGKGIDKAL